MEIDARGETIDTGRSGGEESAGVVHEPLSSVMRSARWSMRIMVKWPVASCRSFFCFSTARKRKKRRRGQQWLFESMCARVGTEGAMRRRGEGESQNSPGSPTVESFEGPLETALALVRFDMASEGREGGSIFGWMVEKGVVEAGFQGRVERADRGGGINENGRDGFWAVEGRKSFQLAVGSRNGGNDVGGHSHTATRWPTGCCCGWCVGPSLREETPEGEIITPVQYSTVHTWDEKQRYI